jgi:hypothetical protein
MNSESPVPAGTGPHPVTLDRAQELAAELDTRQDFLGPRGTAATAQKTASTRPAPGRVLRRTDEL